jgi:hypothetical protein
MDDPPQEPPPPPNAGDPAGTLVIGKFVVEGVDKVMPKTREHVNVFYNQLIMMMDAASPSWQLMWKERYYWIKGVLVRLRNGDEVKHIRRAHPQCYKWSLIYALVNDGKGGFILVICPKTPWGLSPLARTLTSTQSAMSAISRELTPTSNTIMA